MTKPLWAPWRLEYVQHADELEGCVFCVEAAGELPADSSMLIHRGEDALVLLNKFPYSSGHLMAAPIRHVGSLAELTDAETRAARACSPLFGRAAAPRAAVLGRHGIARYLREIKFPPRRALQTAASGRERALRRRQG